MKKRSPRFDKAAEIFKEHGGILRTSEALSAGIHPDTLYAMRDFEVVEVVSRGVFRLALGSRHLLLFLVHFVDSKLRLHLCFRITTLDCTKPRHFVQRFTRWVVVGLQNR
mgnify:CR=1 FL=1